MPGAPPRRLDRPFSRCYSLENGPADKEGSPGESVMAHGIGRQRQEDSVASAPAGLRARWVTLAWAAAPLLAAILVYLNALGGDFVYDDNEQIVNNPWVHELRHLPDVLLRPVWAYKTAHPAAYYRPVQMGLYNLLWAAFGQNPLPFHLVNLLFHLLSVALLFLLVRTLSGEEPVAAAAALLFAVHPLNSEAVAWIACLPELAYASFLLAALLLHALSWSGSRRRRLSLRALSLLLFLPALLSKETAIVLPLLILAMECWVRARALRQAAGVLAPYVVAAVAYLGARLALTGPLPSSGPGNFTFAEMIVQAPVLLLGYVRAILCPTTLLAFHLPDRSLTLRHPLFLGSLLGVVLLGAGVAVLSKRRSDLAFAATLVLLPLLPALYLPALGENAFAERYAYLSTAGAAWIVMGTAAALIRGFRGNRGSAGALTAFALLLALPCAFRTVARNSDWHDDGRLATATLRDEPRAWHMHVVLASWYQHLGRPDRALATLEEGAAAFPRNVILQTAVIDARLRAHRIGPEEAAEALRPIAERHPDLFEAQVNLGVALLKSQRPAEAEAAFRRAVALNPGGTQAREGLFMALVAQGKPPESDGTQEGLSSPDARSAGKLLEGIAAVKAGRLEEAQSALEEARRLDPGSYKALLGLALVADKRGDNRASIDYCRQALVLEPGSEPALEQLGTSALKAGEIQEAVTALEKAVSLDPRGKQALNLLGVAYAQAGRPDEARAAFLKALAIDPGFQSARTNLDALGRREKGPGN